MALSKALFVVKSNKLIESRYTLSVQEQRIILAAIAQIGMDDQVTDQVMYPIRVSEMVDMAGTRSKTIYEDLKEAANRLYERKVEIKFEANGKQRASTLLTRWVQSCKYIDNDGLIEIRFSHDIIPYISGIKNNFTKYKLAEAATLQTAHGIRLFELLMQWQSTGIREISVNDLRAYLMIEDDKYNHIYDLKRWVIDSAVKDINGRTGYMVTTSQRKLGRKIVAIRFEFDLKEPAIDHEAPPKKPRKPRTSRASEHRKGPRLTEALERLAALTQGNGASDQKNIQESVIDRIGTILDFKR